MYGLFVFVLGLILGSFYNVVIFRTLSGESLLFPASHCPFCNTTIKWHHKIPVVSYIFLKGKCSYCGERINIQYPIIELFSGAMFLLLFFKFGLSITFILNTVAMSLFLILAGMDYREQKISSKYAVFLILSCLLRNYSDILNSLLGAILGFIVMYLLIRLSKLAKNEFIGDGDIYIFTAICALTGFNHILYAGVMLSLFLTIYALPYIIKMYRLSYGFIWFSVSYILLFLNKLSVIHMGMFFKILIFVNFFCSLFFILKRLIYDIQNGQKPLIVPLSPSISLTALCYVLFF